MESVVVVATAPRAIGHREQMQFIDAMWHQAARSPRNSEGPKTHKWDIDHSEGAEGKELYLTMKCLTLLRLSLSLFLPLSPRVAFNSAVTFNSVCFQDRPSSRPLGAALTAPRGVEVRGEI